MIGLIGAMDREVDGMVSLLQDPEKKTVSGIDFYTGKLNGTDVVIARSGIGKVFAALCAQAMILTFAPEAIISTGIAGGLGKGLKVGDIVIAEGVVQHDMDTSPIGDPKGLLSGINIITIPTQKSVAERLEKAVGDFDGTVVKGIIASGDQFIDDRSRKESIAASFNAIACDMETAAIGHVCYVNQVPFGAFRVISDTLSGDGGMEYLEFCDIAAARSIAIAQSFCQEVK